MVRTETTTTVADAASGTSVPLILIACIIIALIGALVGFMWLRARRAKKRGGHLHADIGLPETLADTEGEADRRPL